MPSLITNIIPTFEDLTKIVAVKYRRKVGYMKPIYIVPSPEDTVPSPEDIVPSLEAARVNNAQHTYQRLSTIFQTCTYKDMIIILVIRHQYRRTHLHVHRVVIYYK